LLIITPAVWMCLRSAPFAFQESFDRDEATAAEVKGEEDLDGLGSSSENSNSLLLGQ
jgi:hypothetical protein